MQEQDLKPKVDGKSRGACVCLCMDLFVSWFDNIIRGTRMLALLLCRGTKNNGFDDENSICDV